MVKLAIVMGTRPEIIKLSPIIKKLRRSEFIEIFTGQHYDYGLGLRFIEELGLPKPDIKMKLKMSHGHGAKSIQVSEMIQRLGKVFSQTRPDAVIVQGDTDTVLAGSIASLKSKIPICHVESGLRSFDWRMPEEHNRIVADHISDLLFAPTILAKKNLTSESVHGRIFVTGNTIIDAIEENIKLVKRKSTIPFDEDDFVLVTIHRAENIDNASIFRGLIKALLESKTKFVFPIHPHTLKNLHLFGLYNKVKNAKNITLLKTVGYFDMLSLMKSCQFIVTDSGGLQEEATSPQIKKKVLVVRKTTDRPEAVKLGFSELVGTKPTDIKKAINKNIEDSSIPTRNSPYGDGNSSKSIIKLIHKYM
ncbi:UDP-N-acetylglucosamine 2-epimerase (non-hydrolyzing) [Candidatus Pacearchaeota archaeon]|nr:UDP-N-acetylglucosamine 2-epimerase (non-hydrolyzing) [Candidatus Pacearchaeota archaeon]